MTRTAPLPRGRSAASDQPSAGALATGAPASSASIAASIEKRKSPDANPVDLVDLLLLAFPDRIAKLPVASIRTRG